VPGVDIQNVAVIGCGLMGHGIAQVAAQGGCNVLCFEVDDAALVSGLARIDASLDKLAEKSVAKGEVDQAQAKQRRDAARANLRGTLDLADVAECDLVIEAIAENLEAKRELFAELGRTCRPATILASNTSSLPIAEMAAASGRPERCVGLHFFNPVQLMKLVEVVSTEHTAGDISAAAIAFAERCGKTPIRCRDTPGFVVNRLLVPYMVQAMAMVDRGDATPEDIDTGMQLGCGHPMGPLTLADYVGLDTTLFILQGWRERYPDEPAFAVPACLKDKVDAGHLGRKSGQGFYSWDGDRRQ